MRATYALILSAVLFAVAACGDNQEMEPAAEPTPAALPAPLSPPPASPPKMEPAKPRRVVLRHDALEEGAAGQAPGEFGAGEGIAAVFTVPPELLPARILGVQVVMAPGASVADLRIGVHRGSIDEAAPGSLLTEEVREGKAAGVVTHLFQSPPVVAAGSVAAVVHLPDDAKPSLAFVVDPSAKQSGSAHARLTPGAAPTWQRSATLGIRGAWGLRLIVETAQ